MLQDLFINLLIDCLSLWQELTVNDVTYTEEGISSVTFQTDFVYFKSKMDTLWGKKGFEKFNTLKTEKADWGTAGNLPNEFIWMDGRAKQKRDTKELNVAYR